MGPSGPGDGSNDSVDHRASPTRGVGRTDASTAHRLRARPPRAGRATRDVEPGAVGAESIRKLRNDPVRREPPHDTAPPVRCRRVRAADRLRQHRQPDAGENGEPRARDRGASSPRRVTRPDRTTARHRDHCARRGRRSGWRSLCRGCRSGHHESDAAKPGVPGHRRRGRQLPHARRRHRAVARNRAAYRVGPDTSGIANLRGNHSLRPRSHHDRFPAASALRRSSWPKSGCR